MCPADSNNICQYEMDLSVTCGYEEVFKRFSKLNTFVPGNGL